jgi:hypothetical protein
MMVMPSLVIESFVYDAERRELRVLFRSGRAYRYYDVPADVPAAMRAAYSKGAFFNTSVRNRFRCVAEPTEGGVPA